MKILRVAREWKQVSLLLHKEEIVAEPFPRFRGLIIQKSALAQVEA